MVVVLFWIGAALVITGSFLISAGLGLIALGGLFVLASWAAHLTGH